MGVIAPLAGNGDELDADTLRYANRYRRVRYEVERGYDAAEHSFPECRVRFVLSNRDRHETDTGSELRNAQHCFTIESDAGRDDHGSTKNPVGEHSVRDSRADRALAGLNRPSPD